MTWAFLRANLTTPQRLVLLTLAWVIRHAEEKELRVQALADLCELEPRSVQRHLRALERKGLIRIEPRRAADGGNLPNVYRLVTG